MSPRRRFSVGLPERERASLARRLLVLVLLALAAIALARLMLWIARVPTEAIPEERVIRVR
jgi:hypothetical protein